MKTTTILILFTLACLSQARGYSCGTLHQCSTIGLIQCRMKPFWWCSGLECWFLWWSDVSCVRSVWRGGSSGRLWRTIWRSGGGNLLHCRDLTSTNRIKCRDIKLSMFDPTPIWTSISMKYYCYYWYCKHVLRFCIQHKNVKIFLENSKGTSFELSSKKMIKIDINKKEEENKEFLSRI